MNQLDKKHWKKFTFGEIAYIISEHVEPAETNLSVYVGLEHIDTDSIHLSRWGKPTDVDGIKLKFYKGDVIFGKRRAYQRKAALTMFDGICSAHAMVLRANKATIIPELFPFFLHSDSFMHRAVDISEGSLSPTIKWKTLAKQEFTLPPLDQQKELADLLWSAEQLLQTSADIKSKLNILFESKIQNFIRVNNTIVKLGDVSNITMGQSPPGESYNDEKIGIPFIQGNAEFGELNPLRHKFTNKPTKIVAMKSILMSVRAPVGDLNIANKDYCIGRGLCGINSHDSDNMYVFYLLQVLVNKLIKVASGSTFTSVDKKTIESLEIPYPEIKIRKSFSDEMQFLYQFINTYKTYEQNTKVLYKSLVNQIF